MSDAKFIYELFSFCFCELLKSQNSRTESQFEQIKQKKEKGEICCNFTKLEIIIGAILTEVIFLLIMIRSQKLYIICLFSLSLIPALMLIYCAIKKTNVLPR